MRLTFRSDRVYAQPETGRESRVCEQYKDLVNTGTVTDLLRPDVDLDAVERALVALLGVYYSDALAWWTRDPPPDAGLADPATDADTHSILVISWGGDAADAG